MAAEEGNATSGTTAGQPVDCVRQSQGKYTVFKLRQRFPNVMLNW